MTMQHKTKRLKEFAELTGLRINKVKTKIIKINATDALHSHSHYELALLKMCLNLLI